MKSCKILERFLRILLLSFVSTIIKLCKNFQDWRKWMFETRNEYYSSRMIYIYISICSKFCLLPILHQWNETVKDRPGGRSLCKYHPRYSCHQRISKISETKAWIISWKAKHTIHLFHRNDCQTRFHFQYLSLSHISFCSPFRRFVKRERTYHRGDRKGG